ncbi:hypothetical protein MLD38_039417 [Melastoma candidum]|uniref:Uncharacterized protein n=1 Tax=Melastoma candidum TaxID=119954 RepID=A0ACB9L2Q6_9MYRT|nr:hypothetical protein MLD38_039417 [Melastoma candidum]
MVRSLRDQQIHEAIDAVEVVAPRVGLVRGAVRDDGDAFDVVSHREADYTEAPPRGSWEDSSFAFFAWCKDRSSALMKKTRWRKGKLRNRKTVTHTFC